MHFLTNFYYNGSTLQRLNIPLIITQNGRPAGVVLSPSEYDELMHKKLFIDSVIRGISDAESGNVYSTDELREELNKRRDIKKSK